MPAVTVEHQVSAKHEERTEKIGEERRKRGRRERERERESERRKLA
jgi:hypothetical protein